MYIAALKKTVKNTRQHYFLMLLGTISDILFFYFLTRLHVEVFKAAATHIKEAQKIIQSQLDQLTQQEYSQLDHILMTNTQFAFHYHEIIRYIGMFLAGLFAIWFVLRGTNWLIAHKIAESKITRAEFIKRFAFFSAIASLSFILILFLYGGMLNHVAFSPLPLINAPTANAVFGILLFALSYFISVSFALPHHARFRDINKSITHLRSIVPAFLLSDITLTLLFMIPAFLIRTHYAAGLTLTLLITIPLLTFSRVFFINVVKNKN